MRFLFVKDSVAALSSSEGVQESTFSLPTSSLSPAKPIQGSDKYLPPPPPPPPPPREQEKRIFRVKLWLYPPLRYGHAGKKLEAHISTIAILWPVKGIFEKGLPRWR